MKTYLFIYLLVCLSFFSDAQNLVPNPSFEDTLGCPTEISQLYKTISWQSPTVGGTPDYFNQCASFPVGIPNNGFGIEYAHTGVAYAGFYTLNWGTLNIREYIQALLLDTLQANKRYCVEFYVSLADNMMHATNNIGAYFSDSAIHRNNASNFQYTPQVENKRPNMLTQNKGWTRVSGMFIAGGGEIFVTIGNFNDDAHSDTILVMPDTNGLGWKSSYYYIDDVSVYLCDEQENKGVFVPTTFTPNGDNLNDVLYVKGENINTLHIQIYNQWGIKVFEANNQTTGWDGNYKGNPQPIGNFAYIITATLNNGSVINQQGTVSIIR